ncbi:hypothetical protein [Azospirillum sp. ST 5-10]|uniref:hypothetical protein n=1 Tax=unclassified Azospirillum TaxID=2630922 RepID=UPI003F49E5BB
MPKVVDHEAIKRKLLAVKEYHRWVAGKRQAVLQNKFGDQWQDKEFAGQKQHQEFLDAAKAQGKTRFAGGREEMIKQLLQAAAKQGAGHLVGKK